MNILFLFRPADGTQLECFALKGRLLANDRAAIIFMRVLLNDLVLYAVQEQRVMRSYRRLLLQGRLGPGHGVSS